MLTDHAERVGVEAIRSLFAELGWFVREPVRPDYGVDLFVENAEDGRPNGRLLAVQVKSGVSYFGSGREDFNFRVDQRHIDYWLGHSLPVIIVLYDPENRQAFWQPVTAETAESTGKGWRINVPRAQVLDASSSRALAAVAAPGAPESDALSSLRADLTWMEVLATGGSVRLEAREWVNETSGRGDFGLVAGPANGGDRIERQFMGFLGMRPYGEALPEVLPWADLHVDEDALRDGDENLWMEETGMWDSEDQRYIGNSETFGEWRAARFPDHDLRPYAEGAGEVAYWRLSLELNDVGRGVLALEPFLS